MDGSTIYQIMEKIKDTRIVLSNWARSKVKMGPQQIREVEDKLTSLLGQPFTEESIEQKKVLSERLNFLLEQEKTFWHQRAKENWIRLGDRNTNCFHQKGNIQQKRNWLHRLMDDDKVWHEDRGGMEKVVVLYFTNLFTSNVATAFDDILDNVTLMATGEMNIELGRTITDEEVKKTVFQMHPTKSPGLDGMSLGFY